MIIGFISGFIVCYILIRWQVVGMLKADTNYGSGFYSDQKWRKYYRRLQAIFLYFGDTAVFDTEFRKKIDLFKLCLKPEKSEFM